MSLKETRSFRVDFKNQLKEETDFSSMEIETLNREDIQLRTFTD